VRNLNRLGSLKTVSRELSKYKLDLVEIQEVRWDKGGTESADDYTAIYENGNADHHLLTGLFVHKWFKSGVKNIEFVSGRMSYIILRGGWCDVIALNLHAPTKNKHDDTEDSFHEKQSGIRSSS
jgi:hypothetical protein